MSTDNRHRPGMIFKCRRCSSRSDPEIRLTDGVRTHRKRGWNMRAHDSANDVERHGPAYHVRCRECGHLWWSHHQRVVRLVTEARLAIMKREG